MAKTSFTPTAEQCAAAERHIVYEISMFAYCVGQFATGTAPADSNARNALIESFATHTRNLIDFCFSDRVKDDMVADDFVVDVAAWRTARGPLTPFLEDIKERAHKRVAHLTYARTSVTLADKHWDVPQIWIAVVDALVLFKKHVRPGVMTSITIQHAPAPLPVATELPHEIVEQLKKSASPPP